MRVWRGAQCRSENKPEELVVAGLWHNNESARARNGRGAITPIQEYPSNVGLHQRRESLGPPKRVV